jgi:hypothetical protein
MSVTSEIAVAEVIGEDKYDIWYVSLLVSACVPGGKFAD